VGTPANCDGVLGVSGLRQAGTKVGYSSLGPGADIGAPAGNCVNVVANNFYTAQAPCLFQIKAATNLGLTNPIESGSGYTQQVSSNTDGSSPNFGTSFSAPLVAGAAALLYAVNPSLTPQQSSAVLMGTATPFPTSSTTTTDICRVNTVQGTECICTTATCGAGMLNTAAAVNALSAPFGVIQAPTTFNTNTSVSIDGSASFDTTGGQVATYQWSVVNVTGAMPTIANATSGSTTLQATGTSNFTLRLRVTGASGATDDTDFAMSTIAAVTPPSTNTPIGSGGGGGGGGAFDWWLLLLGLLPLALPGPRKRRPARVRGLARRSSPLSEWQHASVSAVRCDRRRRRQNFPE
jgi:serine protease